MSFYGFISIKIQFHIDLRDINNLSSSLRNSQKLSSLQIKPHLMSYKSCLVQQPACDRRRQTQVQSGTLCLRVCVWVTVGSRSERVIDSCHLFHELAELPAAWVAVTHVLRRCDHGTDTLPICVLCRAVDLPAFLWAGVKSLQRHRRNKNGFFSAGITKCTKLRQDVLFSSNSNLKTKKNKL